MTSKCLARAHGGLKCCSQINIVERARLGESVFGTSMGTPVEDAFDFIQNLDLDFTDLLLFISN